MFELGRQGNRCRHPYWRLADGDWADAAVGFTYRDEAGGAEVCRHQWVDVVVECIADHGGKFEGNGIVAQSVLQELFGPARRAWAGALTCFVNDLADERCVKSHPGGQAIRRVGAEWRCRWVQGAERCQGLFGWRQWKVVSCQERRRFTEVPLAG